MSLKNTYSVIMAGGVGERFWPLSTQKEPKQFLDIFTGTPLIKAAIDRMGSSIPSQRAVIVTNQAYGKKSVALFPKAAQPKIIGEPVGKNTAPAIAAAAALIERESPNAVMAVFSADHIIKPEAAFRASVALAAEEAHKNGTLVCLGVKPSFPHTGLGYIETAAKKEGAKNSKLFSVKRFVEKPDAKKATAFLKSGKFLWNCGIFVWSVPAILKAFETHMPELFKLLTPVRKAKSEAAFQKALDTFYHTVQKESIDYGVLEKAKNIAVVECPISWDDMGSFTAFKAHQSKDKEGNVFLGQCLDLDSSDTMVCSDAGLTVTCGLKGLFVIRKGDKLLVIEKSKVPDMRKVIDAIKAGGAGSFLVG